ncbi:DUF4102 domain-containing protein (plasmid) [Escherichia coli]|nr:DUF4102 domain-containing protein [Escherichia coli]
MSERRLYHLVLPVQTEGNKTRAIKVCFGRYPDLGLKTARELRQECREWLALGKDPKQNTSADAQPAQSGEANHRSGCN